jgi:hypothetical protein
MNTIIQQVEMYLTQANAGEAEISDELAEEFGEYCKNLLKQQFSPRERNFALRMSSVGKPLCQQQMEKADTEREADGCWHKFKMLLGDMTEAAAVVIMKAAKVNVQAIQEQVELDIGGINLKGTLDIIIDDKVYDIKSCSPYSFTYKFSKPEGFNAIVEDDPFGYVAQGYLYAEAAQKEFGGWIAINKTTGEWCVCEPPIADNSYRKKALATAEQNIDKLLKDAPFKRVFEAIPETWYSKPTGNKTLDVTCSYCAFKKACWGDAIAYEANPRSKAQYPKYAWYVGGAK